MAVTLDKFKSYIRVDTDYEDSILEDFLTTARAYLVGAVSNFAENYSIYPEFASKADFLQMVLAAEYYQNRDNSEHNLSYTIRSLMAQLQYFDATEISDSDTGSTDSTLTFAMYDGNGNLVDSGIKIATQEEMSEMLEEVEENGVP